MNVESNFETLIKLVIIGDSGVGKSNFLFKFIDGNFSPHLASTVGFDYKSKIIFLPQIKKTIKLQLWDTAGQEKYKSVNKNLFQRVQGIILMYDLTKRESFEHLTDWINLIKKMTSEIPIILIGNKLDDASENRIVTYDEGLNFAKENGMQFLEASASDGTNVEKCFITLSEIIIKSLQEGRITASSNEFVLGRETEISKKSKCKC